jgi:hypothetical protein
MSIPDLDPHALHGIMKMGGKKKLDALIELLKQHGPARITELKSGEAVAAAEALKASASHLGLAALEDLCDQVIEAGAASPALVGQAEAALKRGLAALQAERAKI